MADIENDQLEEEVIDNEEEFVDEDEPVEEPADEEPDEEPESEEQDDEQETWSSDKEYLESRGIEGYDDLDSYIEAQQRLQKELRERQEFREEPTPQQPEKPQGEQFFPRSVFAARVKEMVDQGMVDEKSAAQWKSLASVQDAALNPLIEHFETTLNQIAGGMVGVMRTLRDDSWSKTPKVIKDKFSRKQLDQIMDRNMLFDYRQAAARLAVEGGGDNDLLESLLKSGVTPQKPTRKKPRFSSARRSAPSSATIGGKWRGMFQKNGEVNTMAVNRLTPTQQVAFWSYVEEQHKKAQ